MRRFVTGLLILVSAVCLFASSTSLWVRHNVINTGVFVSNVETIVDLPQVEARVNQRVTETVMTSPAVTDAIDGVVAALPPRLQQFKPTVKTGVQSVVSAGVGRLLTNDPFRPLTRAAVISAHDQLVAGQPVRFTLGQAKNLVPASARDGLAGQVLDLVPDNLGVTIITPADAPRLYNAVDLLKSVWWWVGLIALAALAGALGISRRRRGTLRAWGATTAVLGLLTLIALRVARGQVVVQAKPENRDALGAIYDVLAGSLRSWTLWLTAFALVVLVLTLIWGRLGIVAGIRRGAAAARAQVQRRREARASAAETAAGATPAEDGAPAPAAGESWPRRVAADTRAFVQGLDLDRRAAALGAIVAAHFRTARWAGVVLAVVVLLAWPSPTLSVLVWIGALTALYIGALDWLRAKAPAEAVEGTAPEGIAAAGDRTLGQPAVDGAPRTAQSPSLPVPRPAVDGAAAASPVPAAPDGVPPGTDQQPVAAPPSPAAALEGRVLSPEVLSSLGGRLDLLVRLRQAHEAGVLTDDEFDREKGRLLGV